MWQDTFFKQPKPIRDKAHLEFIASLPCCVCAHPGGPSWGGVAHHLLRTEQKGMGCRSGDDKTIPMCGQHHTVLHATGDETLYLREAAGIKDARILATALYDCTGDTEQAESILRSMRP